jgi:hypothetical protein
VTEQPAALRLQGRHTRRVTVALAHCERHALLPMASHRRKHLRLW